MRRARGRRLASRWRGGDSEVAGERLEIEIIDDAVAVEIAKVEQVGGGDLIGGLKIGEIGKRAHHGGDVGDVDDAIEIEIAGEHDGEILANAVELILIEDAVVDTDIVDEGAEAAIHLTARAIADIGGIIGEIDRAGRAGMRGIDGQRGGGNRGAEGVGLVA